MNVERQTYTVDEYALLLGVSTQTVIAWMKKARIPGEKIEGSWVIRKPEVELWLRGEWKQERKAA